MGSRLRDHTRIFDSGVRARTNSYRTLLAEGIGERGNPYSIPIITIIGYRFNSSSK